MRRGLAATLTLMRREIVRFLRERNRVFGALVQPIMFWGLFGAGLGSSFRPPAGDGSIGYAGIYYTTAPDYPLGLYSFIGQGKSSGKVSTAYFVLTP